MTMSWTGKIGWGLVIALLTIALLAPHVAPHDIREQDLTARLQPPSRAHLMGRDEFGRDVLSRLLYGARVSLRVGLTVVAICAGVGTIIGALAGYYGGWTDRIISGFLFNTLLAFPSILLALARTAGESTWTCRRIITSATKYTV